LIKRTEGKKHNLSGSNIHIPLVNLEQEREFSHHIIQHTITKFGQILL
jgi:hypothetical protein